MINKILDVSMKRIITAAENYTVISGYEYRYIINFRQQYGRT